MFLSEDGSGAVRAKLIDFGIAQRTADLAPADASRGAAVVGTPAYMSPEQVLGEPLSPATDVYALGAIWYFALVGAPPFDDPHPAATMLERVAGDVPRVRSRRPEVPRAIDEVIARCMARTVGARFGSMRLVLEALGAAGVAPITRKRRVASAADLDGIPAAAVVALGSHGQPSASHGGSGPAGEDYERLADLRRLRTMLGWGGMIWATTVGVDLLITSTSTGAGLAYLLPVRLAPTVVAFGVWYGLRRAGAAAVRYVALARAAAVTATAVATALISLGWGGLESPMVGGLSCLLIAEGLAFPARMGAMLQRLAWSSSTPAAATCARWRAPWRPPAARRSCRKIPTSYAALIASSFLARARSPRSCAAWPSAAWATRCATCSPAARPCSASASGCRCCSSAAPRSRATRRPLAPAWPAWA